MAQSMIKYLGIGHSPGDEGESLRESRLGELQRNQTLEETVEHRLALQGDTGEGRYPQRSIFSKSRNSVLLGYGRELELALSNGNRVAIRMVLYGVSVWLTGQQLAAGIGLLPDGSSETTYAHKCIKEIESEQGEWYQYQLGLERRVERQLRADHRQGRLKISRSDLTYTVLPRLHMLSSFDLVLTAAERISTAHELAKLDWRPM